MVIVIIIIVMIIMVIVIIIIIMIIMVIIVIIIIIVMELIMARFVILENDNRLYNNKNFIFLTLIFFESPKEPDLE